jgi:hypothetical protein
MIASRESFEVFQHIRLIVGMVVGLGVARLLNGLARFVQHPKKMRVYLVHMGWVVAMLVFLVHFWWWEFNLSSIAEWTFEAYLLVFCYAIVFFLICSMLFPDQMDEYDGYEDYFISRRKWFFTLFALSFIIDLADTSVKGLAYFNSLGIEYPIRNAVYIILSIAAMFIRSNKFQLAFVVASLIYQFSYIFRLYHTVH